MQCPKCKNVIDDNSLKCSFCNAKIASICKDCGAYNLITATECSSCHRVLLKLCSECGAANMPDAKSCRKCGFDFVKPKTIVNIMPEYSAETESQQKAKVKLIDAIKSAEKRVISVSGESGCGKNLVLRYAMSELKSSNLIWLYGSCTQVSQLSPFGFFQDLLLSFFNINNFCPDTAQLKKNSIKFFKQDFPLLSNSEILDLLNLLYPENQDIYENIYKNKAKTFLMMKKVFSTIVGKMKLVFVIDDFEFIDGMSFDFLKELLKEELILEKCKFVLIYKTPKPSMGCLPSPLLVQENYLDISIAPFNRVQIETLLSQYVDENFSKDFIDTVERVAGGNPAYIEQMVLLKKEIQKKNIGYSNFDSLENIFDVRLSILKEDDLFAYRTLVAMSILGVKFYPALLEHFNNSQAEFERILEKLIHLGYITQINNLAFEFKTTEVWRVILTNVKNDECFDEILSQLLDILSMFKHSSIALIGYIVQKLNQDEQAFEIWTQLMKQATYVGDIGLYIISQKQALKLIETKVSPFYQKVKKNIYTRVGRLLEPFDSEAAFEYLQNAIMLLNDDEDFEHVELLGFLASCSMKKGNYWGAIECVDSVLNKIPEEMILERSLVKSRQAKPLLELGNYGQVINLIETEILPIWEKNSSKLKKNTLIKQEELFNNWLDINFVLVEALTFQANNKMFDVLSGIFDIIEKNKITDVSILCRAHLALALANTVKGNIVLSSKILNDMLKEFPLDSMDGKIVSRWNFIDILNKFFANDCGNLFNDLFDVVAYANNADDSFTKNILKTLLAKILRNKNENKKALEILEEQVAFFAKEKIATGVLLAWYLIAKTKLDTNGTQFALDIATKALDIAQGASINNYYFICLFNKLISEIYMAKQDFDSAKVYLEKAIMLAKQFDLQLILVKCYVLYAKYYQEMALPKSSMRGEYIKNSLKMFQLAKSVEIVAEHIFLQKLIKDELQILTSFCRLNGIVIKKGTK